MAPARLAPSFPIADIEADCIGKGPEHLAGNRVGDRQADLARGEPARYHAEHRTRPRVTHHATADAAKRHRADLEQSRLTALYRRDYCADDPFEKGGLDQPAVGRVREKHALPSGKPPISTRSPTPTLVESPQVTGGTL